MFYHLDHPYRNTNFRLKKKIEENKEEDKGVEEVKEKPKRKVRTHTHFIA